MQIEFEKRLAELGLSYSVHHDAFFTISSRTGSKNHTVVQLIHSLPVNNRVHGSKNGIEVQAIGRFIFKLPSSGLEPDILSFAFPNTVKNRVEFLIIPILEFLRRHVKMNTGNVRGIKVEIVFWLMLDGSVFDTTNISIEAEWYFLSKSASGRVADRTELDYSEYLNSWQWLNV